MPDLAEQIEITVLFFAYLRDDAGLSITKVKLLPRSTVAELKKVLLEKYPRLLSRLPHAIASINKQFANDDSVVPDSAEVAFFPPVSGGEEKPTIVDITDSEIDLNQVIKSITNPLIGGICFFVGVVRGGDSRPGGHETQSLEYQAYTPMAVEKLKQISDEIRKQWVDVHGIAIFQRVGVFEPGAVSVVIACSAGHRDQGIFEACRYAIDRLKQIVPVWKKEIGSTGVVWIEGDYLPGEKD